MTDPVTSKEITIGGAIVPVSTPYAEGHTMTEAEARSLNQTRAENIANNCRKFVNERNAGDAKSPVFTEAQMSEIHVHVAEYDSTYEFTLASVGGGRKTMDPLEKEAMAIARALITAKIKAGGGKVKDYDKDKLAAKVAEVSEMPQVQKAAKKAVADKAKLASDAMDEMDLDGIGAAVVDEPAGETGDGDEAA